jgi:hypothetical protein
MSPRRIASMASSIDANGLRDRAPFAILNGFALALVGDMVEF